MSDLDNKKKALQLILDKMDKAYGKGTVMRMGDSAVDDKIEVIPWGISHNLFHKTRHSKNIEVIKKLGITMPYFLSVSCTKERKNIPKKDIL